MLKKAALITVHGMGSTKPNYNKDLVQELKERIGPRFRHLHVGKVYYQDLLQANEERVWNAVAKRVKWDALRRFLLFGFADAAGLESSRDELDGVYTQAQVRVARELWLARQALAGDGPVVVLAQSLGGQVTSCYFWDAVRSAAHPQGRQYGIWQDLPRFTDRISDNGALTAEELAFIRGGSLHAFITTGCNIPIFVAAHATDQILPIHPNDTFYWQNFYDKDDVLGWPLADLSPEYASVVQDHRINAGGGVLDWLLKSWNPMSHGQYWGDDDVLDPLEELLTGLLA